MTIISATGLPLELELKLKVGTDKQSASLRADYIQAIRDFILANPHHYHPAKPIGKRPDFFKVPVTTAQIVQVESGRIYYDTPDLRLFRNDPKVEWRVKSRFSPKNGDHDYIQAIKIGKGMSRVEIEEAVRYSKPQLSVLKPGKNPSEKKLAIHNALQTALGAELTFQNFPLVPLVCVYMSSVKIFYNPDENEDVCLEAKLDIAAAITAVDYLDDSPPLESFQVELEVKENETGKPFDLEAERQYLYETFNAHAGKRILRPTGISKPSHALKRVQRHMNDPRFEAAVSHMGMHITPQTFQETWKNAFELG